MEEDLPDFRTMSAYDLIDMLVADYPPRCIRNGETEIQAHRYAGAVDLVQGLARAKQAEIEARD